MADKHDKKADAPAEGEGAEKKKGGLLTKLPVLLGGTMVIEAVLIIGVVKVLGVGSKPAQAVAEVVPPGGDAVAPKAEGDDKAAEGGDKKEAGKGEEKPTAEGEGKGAEKPAAEGDKGAEKGEAKGEAGPKAPKSPFVEIELTNFRAPNMQSGHRIVYDIQIFASVRRANETKMRALIKDRKATVEDRIRTIIATLDPEKLGGGSEPGLETLRRQVKYALDEVAGESLINEVLISRCLPYRAD
jgi:flagellar basal body-associated protein FliL